MGDGMTSGLMGNARKRSPATPRSMNNSRERFSDGLVGTIENAICW